jgi:hypothetical protein
MERRELEGKSRDELMRIAEARGVARARSLTIPELIDGIVSAAASPRQKGWLGKARDLLTSVIDRGLAAPADPARSPRRKSSAPPPLPTVTLAEIYAAQGHLERALTTLDEVLAREPSHAEAAKLHERYTEQLRKTKPSIPPQVIEARPVTLIPPAPAAPRIDPIDPVAPAVAAPSAPPDPPAAPFDEATPAEVAEVEPEGGFEVDEIVALAVDPTTVYLYWEIKPGTLAAARAVNEDGALVVRVLGVTPTSQGPSTEVRDTRVDALSGELFVRGLPPATEIRVSVGYKSGHSFEPFAVGIDLVTPRAAPAAEVGTRVRKYSDAGLEPMSAEPRHLQRGIAFPPSARAGGGSPMLRDSDDVASRFPAGVWVDPSTRVVQVSESTEGDQVRGEFLSRLPGSSEIFRKTAVWSMSSRAG